MFSPAKFVLSKTALMKQYNIVEDMCDQVSYSAKTNYEVGKVLEELTDCFFSIHTLESLHKIKDKKRVWFLTQAWDEKELDVLFKEGVENFIVDNEKDLKVFLDYIKDKNVKVNLLLRIRLEEHTIHTGKYFVFGLYSDQVNRIIPELRENKNITKLGIHFHRKTQNISEWSLKYELENLISKDVLEKIDYVNIGGGIPVKYKNFRAEVLDNIFSEIKKLREWLKQYNIKLIIEAGRYIAAPCVKLHATIKNVYNNNIILNCSVYNTSMDTFIVHNKLEVEDELPDGEGKPYCMKGQTPCSMDIFRYRIFLKDPKIGDNKVFLNAGAYNFSSDFCNLPKLETEIED
ncbi:MAG: decarboxylase [Nanoarchaeota archaeon]|nr:decarboxylase [Nanoarchaeota archaeon]